MVSRLYLPSTTTAAVSPTISADFEHQNGARRQMATRKVASAFATTTYTPDAADHIADQDAQLVQFVSPPLVAQTIAAQTAKLTIIGSEANAGNNCFLTWKLFLCDSSGAVGSTILAIRRDGTELSTTLQNRTDSATTTQVTASAGDRLVLEIGAGGSPTASGGTQGHNGALRFGDSSGSDLAEDDTSTTDANPWLEFANTLTWQTDPFRDKILATTGLQSYWRFGETSGTNAVDEAGLVAGTYTNGPTLNQASLLAMSSNPSISLDGTDDQVAFGNNYAFTGTSAFSVELLLRVTSFVTTNRFDRIIAREEFAPSHAGWDIYLNDDGSGPSGQVAVLERYSGGSQLGSVSLGGILTGVTYHMVFTYDGANMAAYLNGVISGPVSGGGSMTVSGTPSLVAGNALQGRMDELAIYNVALSQATVSDHYSMAAGFFVELARQGVAGIRQMQQLTAQ